MFVVVYLCEPKVNIVVPQKFIYGLSQQNLNNYGKKRYQKYLIFWSKKALIGDVPDLSYAPNFESNVCTSYPPPEDEACFFGKIKYFYGKSDKKFIYLVIYITYYYTL